MTLQTYNTAGPPICADLVGGQQEAVVDTI